MNARKMSAVVVSLALLVGCEQSTAPAETVEVSVQTALTGGGAAFDDGDAQPAIHGRLVHVAIGKIRKDSGAEAARAAVEELKPYVTAARDARSARDSAALRSAIGALRSAEATLVIETLGTDVATRSLAFAAERLEQLEKLIARADAAGRDPARLEALSTELSARLDAAEAAAAAGAYATALIGAADIIQVLHAIDMHGRGADLPRRDASTGTRSRG